MKCMIYNARGQKEDESREDRFTSSMRTPARCNASISSADVVVGKDGRCCRAV